MNKKILVFVIMPVLALMLVTAGVLTYMGQVQRDVIVTQAFAFTGDGTSESLPIIGGESVISDDLSITSFTDRLIPLSILTGEFPVDTDNIHHTVNYLLSSTESIGTSNENRISIRAEDTEVTILSDLMSISWDVNGTGYIAHIDVFLDNGEVLVFEYAKVKTPFDNLPYPEGSFNTFKEKGVVDNNAGAWISSGCSGGSNMVWYTLSDWKLGQTGAITKCDGSSEKTYDISGNTGVIRFEVETDNWIIDSESVVRNILINGEFVEVSLKPLDSLNFNVETEFDFETPANTYTITTTVDVRE